MEVNMKVNTKKESNMEMDVLLSQMEAFLLDNLQPTRYRVSANIYGKTKKLTLVSG
jgi:hypothetical protein